MAENRKLFWVILPYLAVFLGMLTLRNAWAGLIGFHLALLPVLLLQRNPHAPGLAPVSWKILLPVGLGGALGGVVIWMAWSLLGLPSHFGSQAQAVGLPCQTSLPFSLYLTLVNPALEELYWRGALGSPNPLPQLSDFLYAGYHFFVLFPFVSLPWILPSLLVLALAGWFWRLISWRTGSLLPAILSHALADASILAVLALHAC
jgi:membrane protease YdiL (CAAX protease family)